MDRDLLEEEEVLEEGIFLIAFSIIIHNISSNSPCWTTLRPTTLNKVSFKCSPGSSQPLQPAVITCRTTITTTLTIITREDQVQVLEVAL
jgi:hypothetical protein